MVRGWCVFLEPSSLQYHITQAILYEGWDIFSFTVFDFWGVSLFYWLLLHLYFKKEIAWTASRSIYRKEYFI